VPTSAVAGGTLWDHALQTFIRNRAEVNILLE